MANDNNDNDRRPIGDVIAQVSVGSPEHSKTQFIELGPVWTTESGNIKFEMRSEPLAWADRSVPRRCIIRFRDGYHLGRSGEA